MMHKQMAYTYCVVGTIFDLPSTYATCQTSGLRMRWDILHCDALAILVSCWYAEMTPGIVAHVASGYRRPEEGRMGIGFESPAVAPETSTMNPSQSGLYI